MPAVTVERSNLWAGLAVHCRRFLAGAAIAALVSARLYAGDIELRLDGAADGPPVSGSGTNAGTMDLGTVSAFEATSAMVTRSTGASSFTVSARFGVRVIRNAGTSPSYTLQCRSQTTHPLTWTVNGVTMTTTLATVATFQPYDSTQSHTVSFTVPFSSSAGSIAGDFELLAIAN